MAVFQIRNIAKVALVWMVRQAEAAGVNMNDDPSLATIVANPVIHDKSSNLLAGAPEGGPTATSEDRVIRFGDGSSPEQRTALINGMSYEDTVPFINYKANPIPSTVFLALSTPQLTSSGSTPTVTTST